MFSRAKGDMHTLTLQIAKTSANCRHYLAAGGFKNLLPLNKQFGILGLMKWSYRYNVRVLSEWCNYFIGVTDVEWCIYSWCRVMENGTTHTLYGQFPNKSVELMCILLTTRSSHTKTGEIYLSVTLLKVQECESPQHPEQLIQP